MFMRGCVFWMSGERIMREVICATNVSWVLMLLVVKLIEYFFLTLVLKASANVCVKEMVTSFQTSSQSVSQSD